MNKRGFMFIETIVTLTVLMVLLLSLYTVFSNLLQKEKVVAEYDKYGDKYALYYYKEKKLKEGNQLAEEKYHLNTFGLSYSGESNSRCNLVVLKCENPTLLNSLTGDECTISEEFESYINYVKCDTDYKILGEFQTVEGVYTYAHIVYPNN